MNRSRVVNVPDKSLYIESIRSALMEDLEHGDITTDLTVGGDDVGSAFIIAKEDTLVAGGFVAREVFRQLDPGMEIALMNEGSLASSGQIILEARGNLRAILMGERVALNFLQRLCGIATFTSSFVERVEGIPCRIVDTRKTTPGLRLLEKYAVRVGGGYNHRYGLSDGILIKDNHISACGSVHEAVSRARMNAPHPLRIEVEVTTLEELREAISAGADAVLLDNMDISTMKRAVALARDLKPRLLLEASGGISLHNVREVALTGVDIISVGALTHSARAVDLSLRLRGD